MMTLRRFIVCAVWLLAAAFPAAAQPEKVVRTSFRAQETGFDPQRIDDRYSVGFCENIFETLLTYDYLARPVKLVPLVAEKVPEPQEDGTLYEFKIKPGIYFHDDPAFNGKKRELVAQDMEYAIKRFRDARNRSPYEWLFEHKIVGLDEYAKKNNDAGRFNYDEKVPGLQVVDKYTLRVKLIEPDFNFLYVMAMPNVVPVAREVIERYGEDTMAHPIGTGPFKLKSWERRSKIVLERNKDYRGFKLDERYADPKDEWDQRAIADLRGKTLPIVDRVEVDIIEQEQPRFLAFMSLDHDFMDELPFGFLPQIMPNNKLAPKFEKEGLRVFPETQPELTYDVFNIDDPVVGGYTPDKIALRRAIIHGFDRDAELGVIRKGQGVFAEAASAPGIVGYDPTFRLRENEFDPARARALLDLFGYVDKDGDGWRDLPDGKPFTIEYKWYATGEENRQTAALWVKSMAAIGIKMEAKAEQFSDLLRDRKVGKFQFSMNAWIADYPDAQNFLQLMYGPNTGQSNDSRMKLKAFDDLYNAAAKLPDGPERNRLYREMNRVAAAYAPWRFGMHRVWTHLIRPWVKGYKKHPILYTNFKYLDIDTSEQARALAGGK